MKIRMQFIQLFSMAFFLFAVATACDKTDDPDSDFPSAGIVKDADGNTYNTIKIGTQVWMVENLKTIKYNDGTSIPNVTDNDAWTKLKTGAYCNYHNLEINAATYGRLYNWYAVNTGKLAPKGWHVPTDTDWTILENYLIANGYNFDGTKTENKIAKSLCAKTNWELSSKVGTPGDAPKNNNSSGFTALPGGLRNNDFEDFQYLEDVAYWWSSTIFSEGKAYTRGLGYSYEALVREDDGEACGFSVRLVRD